MFAHEFRFEKFCSFCFIQGVVLWAQILSFMQARFGLAHVFCWHSFYGYWAGVAPESPEMAAFNPQLVWPQPGQGESAPFSSCCDISQAL